MNSNYDKKELIKEINSDLAAIKTDDKDNMLQKIFNIKTIEKFLKDTSVHEYILFDNIRTLAKKLCKLYEGFPDYDKSPIKELKFYTEEVNSYNFLEDRDLITKIVAKFQKSIKGTRKAHGINNGSYIDFPRILSDDIEEVDRITLKNYLEDIGKMYFNIAESKEWLFINEKILELEKKIKDSDTIKSGNLEISSDIVGVLMISLNKALSLKEQYSSEIKERKLNGDRVFKIFLLCIYNKLNDGELDNAVKDDMIPLETVNKIILFCFKYHLTNLQNNFKEIQPYVFELISFAQKINPNIFLMLKNVN